MWLVLNFLRVHYINNQRIRWNMKFFENNMNVMYAASVFILIGVIGAIITLPSMIRGDIDYGAYNYFGLESLLTAICVIVVIYMYKSNREGKTRMELFLYTLFLSGLIYAVQGGISVFAGTVTELKDTQIGGAVALVIGIIMIMLSLHLMKNREKACKPMWYALVILFAMGFIESISELTYIPSGFIEGFSDAMSGVEGLYASLFMLAFLAHYEIREGFKIRVRSE